MKNRIIIIKNNKNLENFLNSQINLEKIRKEVVNKMLQKELKEIYFKENK